MIPFLEHKHTCRVIAVKQSRNTDVPAKLSGDLPSQDIVAQNLGPILISFGKSFEKRSGKWEKLEKVVKVRSKESW